LEKQVMDQEPRTCPQIRRLLAARGPRRGRAHPGRAHVGRGCQLGGVGPWARAARSRNRAAGGQNGGRSATNQYSRFAGRGWRRGWRRWGQGRPAEGRGGQRRGVDCGACASGRGKHAAGGRVCGRGGATQQVRASGRRGAVLPLLRPGEAHQEKEAAVAPPLSFGAWRHLLRKSEEAPRVSTATPAWERPRLQYALPPAVSCEEAAPTGRRRGGDYAGGAGPWASRGLGVDD